MERYQQLFARLSEKKKARSSRLSRWATLS